MTKRLLLPAFALLLTVGASSLHAQNTTVTRRGRDGRMVTTVVRGTGTGFAYTSGSGTNASAIRLARGTTFIPRTRSPAFPCNARTSPGPSRVMAG